MNMKPALSALSRHIRRTTWVNALLFTLPAHAIISSPDESGVRTALMIVLWTFVLGIGNHLVMKNFLLRRIVSECRSQIRSIRQDMTFDELTGVYSRKAGLARLSEEFSRSRRYGPIFSVAMIDIDHFKRVNDRYGHLVGDQVLRQIALRFRSGLRDCDVVARYGGEEFLLILPETDERQALVPLERLRRRVCGQPFTVGPVAVEISVSVGVTTVFPLEEELSEAIGRADQALYAAKRDGRNRVATLGPAAPLGTQPAHA